MNEYLTTGSPPGTPVGTNPLIGRGLSVPMGLAVSGGTLYVANQGNGSTVGTVSAYNANSGKPDAVPLVSGLSKPTGLAVSGRSRRSRLHRQPWNGSIRESSSSLGRKTKRSLHSELKGAPENGGEERKCHALSKYLIPAFGNSFLRGTEAERLSHFRRVRDEIRDYLKTFPS